MRKLWAALTSLRTTAILIAVLAVLLLLNVALPQRAVDADAYAAAVRTMAGRFVLQTLGLGEVSQSAVFVATLAAFFVNLAAVLSDRLGTTLRRVRFVPPNEAQLQALLAAPGGLEVPRAAAASPDEAPAILGRAGYRAVAVKPGVVWGVKYRLALLGFPVFHASFFFMFAGGLQLFLTRDVVTLLGAEGQPLRSDRGGIVRRAPLGAPPPFDLVIERVDARIVDGRPVELAATIVREDGLRLRTRINHPAEWDAVTVLVERAGIAPVLWLTDAGGFTIDRVVVPAASKGDIPARAKLGAGDVEAVIDPIPVGEGFPERDDLGRVPVSLRILVDGKKAFEGRLRPGEAAELGDRTVRVQEVRYFAGLRVVSERGGDLLVIGFVLSVVGIVWRMLWYRREVVASWDEGAVRIAGRAEFFGGRFRGELEDVARLLAPSATPRERAA